MVLFLNVLRALRQQHLPVIFGCYAYYGGQLFITDPYPLYLHTRAALGSGPRARPPSRRPEPRPRAQSPTPPSPSPPGPATEPWARAARAEKSIF